MAKANPANLNPQPPPEPEGGPVIEYRGDGADKVVFAVHPLARHYLVHASGQVLETF